MVRCLFLLQLCSEDGPPLSYPSIKQHQTNVKRRMHKRALLILLILKMCLFLDSPSLSALDLNMLSSAWLNNCVGHFNQRYFFSFCLYMTLGCFYCSVSSKALFLEAYGAIEVRRTSIVCLYGVTGGGGEEAGWRRGGGGEEVGRRRAQLANDKRNWRRPKDLSFLLSPLIQDVDIKPAGGQTTSGPPTRAMISLTTLSYPHCERPQKSSAARLRPESEISSTIRPQTTRA